MSRYQAFAPVLIYLVEHGSCYMSPLYNGFVSGQTAWADRTLHFQNHGDAKKFADAHGGKVIKLRVYAKREAIKGPSFNPADVPKGGADAFHQGWSLSANPYPKESPDALDWLAAWHAANAVAYRAHVEEKQI